MSARTGRGSTGPGRHSALPDDGFQAPAPVTPTGPRSMVVEFHGDDDRRGTFDFGRLPMPGWRPLLAEAFALRTGHSGESRTLASARGCFSVITRLAQWLDRLERAPATPGECTRAVMEAFVERPDHADITRQMDTEELRRCFEPAQVRPLLPPDVFDVLCRRIVKARGGAVGGYSSGEWDRLIAAARADSAVIARRVRGGLELVRRLHETPETLGEQEHERATVLAQASEGGRIPSSKHTPFASRSEIAGMLGLVAADLPPLMVLMAALTERNGESVKELPAEHRILEDRAVELHLTKRRRGAKRWTETVTWEIGQPGRELHTPGGFYLLVHELTAHARAVCGSPLLLCVWSQHSARAARGEFHAPFQDNLARSAMANASGWAASRARPVLADPDAATGGAPKARPLPVSFNRIKTTADARRTRALGGHLPSAAKSNTAQVLFRNYLRPDQATREWAEEVMAEALAEAERSVLEAHEAAALRAHEAAVTSRGGGPSVVHAAALPDGCQETAWAACRDHEHHPATGRVCGESFLDCFHCGNCLVTHEHLPALLALLDALVNRYQLMDQDRWWARYGPTWAAVRRDILAKFDPAEVAAARTRPSPVSEAVALLDLVEAPWEHL